MRARRARRSLTVFDGRLDGRFFIAAGFVVGDI
jgi:hypothetical protein